MRCVPAAGLLSALLVLAPAALASPVGELEPEDAAVVEALALYDDALRREALEAATEADVLGELVRRQERSSATFRRLLEPYDREVQEDLYELARYPELVAEIVDGGPKSQAELDAVAFRYPNEAAAAAARSGREHWKLIARTDMLLRDENAGFEATIALLPERKRDAFRALVSAPDLLVMLAENPGVSVLLGDAYDREPDAVVAWLDEVERDAAARGGEETRELAQALAEDDELAADLAAAAEEYAQDTGQSAYPPAPVHQTNVSVNVTPFPFWIGYPWWYANTYAHYDPWYWWYPNFAWSFGGAYFGPHFNVSFGFGWPNGAFWGWYFGAPIHHYRYPRLTNRAVYHYERYRGAPYRYRGVPYRVARYDSARRFHPRHARPGRHAVHRFVHDTERSMPRGFLARDGRRGERFREYGRLHDESARDRSGRRVRGADRQRQRDDDLIRRARADADGFPRLASLSREPKRSRAADRRKRAERAQRDERRRASDDAGRDVARREAHVARGSWNSSERARKGRADARTERRTESARTKRRDHEQRSAKTGSRSERRREWATARAKSREPGRAKREQSQTETRRRERREARIERAPRKAREPRDSKGRSQASARREVPRAEPRVERSRREPRAERRSESAPRRMERGGSGRARRDARRSSEPPGRWREVRGIRPGREWDSIRRRHWPDGRSGWSPTTDPMQVYGRTYSKGQLSTAVWLKLASLTSTSNLTSVPSTKNSGETVTP
jgi:hypothetical protein